jgi:uncharacterized phage protein (TIGR01671 family)
VNKNRLIILGEGFDYRAVLGRPFLKTYTMRYLIFRAWQSPLSSEPFVTEEGFMAYQGTPDIETLQSFMHHYADSEHLMQFTGIYDKNEKEIFEDDIVFVHEEMETTTGHKSRVFINHDGTIILSHPAHIKMGLAPYRRLSSFNDIEVIGNIYENPELLNSEQNDKSSVATDVQ